MVLFLLLFEEMNDAHLIGFSLSFCIRDILRGKVKVEDVLHLHTACRMESEDDIRQCVKQYCKSYWKDFEVQTIFGLINHLRKDNRISWLSSFEPNPMFIGWGHWLSTKNSIKFG